jgi:glutamine synthetase
MIEEDHNQKTRSQWKAKHRRSSCAHQAIEAVRASACARVKLAVTDIDGHPARQGDSLPIASLRARRGLRLQRVRLRRERPALRRRPPERPRLGFPDANVRLDPSTLRKVPWDDDVPFLLGEFVKATATPHPLCPRQLLKRVLRARRGDGTRAVVGSEYEFFNFKETPETWSDKRGNDPTPITQGMFGYSLLRANAYRDYFTELMELTARFRVPLDSLHTENGPGLRGRDPLRRRGWRRPIAGALQALGQGDRRAHGIMPVLHGEVAPAAARLRRPHPPEPFRWQPQRVLRCGGPHNGCRRSSRAISRASSPSSWNSRRCSGRTMNSYKRLVEGAWAPVRATWGVDNRTAAFRVLTGSPTATRLETRCPGADVNPYSRSPRFSRRVSKAWSRAFLYHAAGARRQRGRRGRRARTRTLVETTRIFHASRLARGLVRVGIRRLLRRDPRARVAPVAGRRHRLGAAPYFEVI